MPTLQEILDNAQFGDDVQFDFNGNKIPLKDLRALRATAANEEKIAKMKRAEAEKNALEAATLLQKLSEQAGKTPETKPALDPNDWRNDPVFSPFVKEFETRDAESKKLRAEIEATKKALDNAQAVYALERLRTQYETSKDKLKGKSFEDLATEAIRSGDVDENKLPTLRKVIDRITEPDRMEAYAQEKLATERKKWEEERHAADVGKPGGGGTRFRSQKGKESPIKRIEDLNADVIADDPDIRAAMEGTVS